MVRKKYFDEVFNMSFTKDNVNDKFNMTEYFAAPLTMSLLSNIILKCLL